VSKKLVNLAMGTSRERDAVQSFLMAWRAEQGARAEKVAAA
jgi:hypothetical protein